MKYVERYDRWYCRHCKKYAEKEAVEEEKYEEPEPVEEGGIICPMCQATLPEDATVCDKCGSSLVEAPPPEPEEEVGVPIEVEGEVQYLSIDNLKWGGLHLMKSEDTEPVYGLIEEAVSKGYPAVCFTRDFPKKIREIYNFGETKIYWLSNIGKADTIRPKNLEKLSLSMEQFLAQDKTGVILLSGIDYLITNNNFITVLRLIQSLRDQVAVSNSILIIPVNPSVLEENQLRLLEREVDFIL